jgi:O-antigen ligase
MEEIPLVAERETVQTASLASVLMRCSAAGVLIAAPLCFGATSVYASAGLIAAAWILFAALIVQSAVQGKLNVPTHPLALPAVMLLAFAAMHWLLGISLAPDAAKFEWLKWLGYACLAISVSALFDTAVRMSMLMRILAICGFAVALLGIAQHLTAGGKIYWMIEPPYGGWAFGPYVNRNHFAGLMELWMPLALGLAMVPGTRPWMRSMWWLATVAMSCAVVLSGSRAGLIVLGAQFAMLTLWAVAQRGKRAALAAIVTVAVVVIAAFAIGGRGVDRVVDTIQPARVQLDEVAGNRIQAWKDTMRIFEQSWLIGKGLESFPKLFPAVRTFATDKYWSHAHNDFLQFLAELGIAGAALAGWILFAGGRSAVRNLRECAHSAYAPLLAALACACLGFLMHGWLDFNFHVPANAANFAVLAALLVRRGWNEV